MRFHRENDPVDYVLPKIGFEAQMEVNQTMKKSRFLFLVVIGVILSVGALLPVSTPVLAAAPTVTSVTPDQGLQGQTINVTITGTDFTGATLVTFGAGITINSLTVDNDTRITVNITISSSASPVPRNVSVVNASGVGTKLDGFTVWVPPTMESVSPGQGGQGQTLDVTMAGTCLEETTSVYFGSGITVNAFNVDNATQITANITITDSAAVGFRDVSATTLGGTATKGWGFRVFAPPAVASLSLSEGLQGKTLDITITGTFFSGTTSVDFGPGITVNSFDVASDGQIVSNITITESATPGARDVSVTTPGGTGTLVDGLMVLPVPTISSISPNQGEQGQTLDIIITGTYFSEVMSVSFSPGITVNSFAVDSSMQITANITIEDDDTIGIRSVSVSAPGCSGTLADGFTVTIPYPNIAQMTPSSGKQGQSLEVIIVGSNFSGATGVSLGAGITVDSFTVDSATQITAQVTIDADATKGPRDVSVSVLETSGTLANAFEVEAGASGIPMYVWILAGGMAAAGLLGLVMIARRKKQAAH